MTTGKDIQVEDGRFIRIHQEIAQALARAKFTGSEYRCLWFLFSKTYGWQKKEDTISLSQWAEGIGIDKEKRHNIRSILQGLVAKRVIYTRSNGNNRPATWGFNKYIEQWDASVFNEQTVMPQHNSSEQTVMPEDNTSVMPQHNSSEQTVMPQHNETVMPGHPHKRKKEREQLASCLPAPEPSANGATPGLPHPPSHDPPPVDLEFAEFVKAYTRLWGKKPESEAIGDEIAEWSNRITLEGWRYALKECLDQNMVGKWKYLRAILERVEREGYVPKQVSAVSEVLDINILSLMEVT